VVKCSDRGASTPTQTNIVPNWSAELARRVSVTGHASAAAPSFDRKRDTIPAVTSGGQRDRSPREWRNDAPREGRLAALVDFTDLYRAHAQDLRRFAWYLSGDAALADDLVSEAFVRVWTARDRVAVATVRGYLFATLRNLFLQHLRQRRRRVPLDDHTVDERPGPEEHWSGRESLRCVLAALARLPEVDRAAVLMRADDGLPYEEIAAVLGISVACAKVKVHRARLRLAEALQAHPDPGRTAERQP